MQVIYCFGGNRETATRIWNQTPMLPGFRSDYRYYGRVKPAFLDYPFHSKIGWARHVKQAQKHRPTIAMIPDIEHTAQLYTFPLMYAELRATGAGIMVTPKISGIVGLLPDDIVIGVSVPSEYAGFLPHPAEVKDRKLHLLGGHPDQQAYLAQHIYTDAQVVSADGNMLHRKAQWGQYWSLSRGNWRDVRGQYSNIDLMLMSAQNIVTYLHQEHESFASKKRIDACNQHLAQVGYAA